ncbi:MAG: hypothetical protein ACYDC6_15765 [Acidobacteriaceae bacterium]
MQMFAHAGSPFWATNPEIAGKLTQHPATTRDRGTKAFSDWVTVFPQAGMRRIEQTNVLGMSPNLLLQKFLQNLNASALPTRRISLFRLELSSEDDGPEGKIFSLCVQNACISPGLAKSLSARLSDCDRGCRGFRHLARELH